MVIGNYQEQKTDATVYVTKKGWIMSYQAVCKAGDYKLYGWPRIGTECFAMRHAVRFNHVVEVTDSETGQVTEFDARLSETTQEPPF